MMFKSRQVNLDPKPWVAEFGTDRYILPDDTSKATVYDPRPEFEPTRDPLPVIHHHEGCIIDGRRIEALTFSLDEWAPRRERFDTPVNRVLTDFRKHWEPLAPTPGPREAQIYLEVTDLDGGKKQPLYWSTDEIDHARRVLTRLANWKEISA